MDPSCSNVTFKSDGNVNNTICKTDNAIESRHRSDSINGRNVNPKQIDKIEREDYEEENRLIKHCSDMLMEAAAMSANSFPVSSGSSLSEDKDINLPGCSSSSEGDSNTTIKKMLQPLFKKSHYKKYGGGNPYSAGWKSRSSHEKCSHQCDREDAFGKLDKSTQRSDYGNNGNSSSMGLFGLLDNSMASTSRNERRVSEGRDDSQSAATRNFLEEYYNGDAESDDEETENVWCTCFSSDEEDDSEAENSKSESEEINRAWRKRQYEPNTASSSLSVKKFCSEPSTSSGISLEDSWLRNLPASNSIINSRIPAPPELKQWLHRFNTWSNSERIQAIDALISHSAACQVRHMMNAIEPLFQRDFISLLPKELALTVLGYLEPEDLMRAAQTCRYWRFLADDNLLWREQCRRVGITSLKRKTRSSRVSTSPWKAAYMRQHTIESNWVTRQVNQPIIMKGHDDHVITCLQFYGNRIVSGSDDTTLKVWSAVTGRCLKTLVGHTGGVWSSQMYGHLVISGSTDRTLRVWNAKTGQCLKVLAGHTSTVRCMQLYKDRVVSGSRDATLRVWSIPEGRCQRVLIGHMAAVRCVQYDGKVVVSGAYDYFVKVWNPDTGECLHTLAGHTNRVYSLQFDGVHIVSGSLDTSIRVWDVESGQLKHTLIGHQSLTSGMELHSNILVSGNADSTVKVWDISTGHCIHTLSGPNKHQSAVTCLQSTKRFVITSSDDGTVKLWDVRTGEFIRNLVELGSGGSGGVVWRIRASATKLICAVGSRNGTEETKLLVLNFDLPATCYRCIQ